MSFLLPVFLADRNYYPVEEARRSNMRHRPIGLGVQGLEDAFMIRLPFENETVQRPSFDIFEMIDSKKEKKHICTQSGTNYSIDL